MNRPYNFRMPPDSTRRQSMEQLQRMEPVQSYTGLMQPLMAPASATRQLQPLELEPPISSQPMAPMASASQTSGSLELSDPYLRELMRYYSPSAQPMAQPMAQPQSSPMPQPNEEGLKLDPYMQELIRRYQPSMPQMPAGLSPMSRPQSSQANAFFTL